MPSREKDSGIVPTLGHLAFSCLWPVNQLLILLSQVVFGKRSDRFRIAFRSGFAIFTRIHHSIPVGLLGLCQTRAKNGLHFFLDGGLLSFTT